MVVVVAVVAVIVGGVLLLSAAVSSIGFVGTVAVSVFCVALVGDGTAHALFVEILFFIFLRSPRLDSIVSDHCAILSFVCLRFLVSLLFLAVSPTDCSPSSPSSSIPAFLFF